MEKANMKAYKGFDKVDTWAAVVVEGENIKPDTWYTVKDGKFVEA